MKNSRALFPVVIVGGILLAKNFAFAADAPAAAVKDYTMFVGADLFLIKDKQSYPILYAEGKMLDVKIDGELKHVHIREANTLRATPSLKLTRAMVTISGFKQEQAFTSAANPHLKWGHDNAVSAELAFAAQDAAAPKFTPFKDIQEGAAAAVAAHGISAPAPPAASPSVGAPNLPSSPGELARTSMSRLDSTDFDAIDVNFELSSSRRITAPYIALITDITNPQKPERPLRWFYIQTIQDLDERPQKIQISEAGFPPGFKILSSTVHVYSKGHEVATNQAEGQLQMSLDEAHEYLVIQHLASHRSDTMGPTLAIADLPADFSRRVAPEQLKLTLLLKISVDGKIAKLGPHPDSFDPYLAGVVRNFRFTPALEKGRAVEGEFRLDLREIGSGALRQ